jgi:hypothetical protein
MLLYTFLNTPGYTRQIATALVLQNISNGEIFFSPICTLKIPASVGGRELVDLYAQCNTTFLTHWFKNGKY